MLVLITSNPINHFQLRVLPKHAILKNTSHIC